MTKFIREYLEYYYIKKSGMFDSDFYLQNNPTIRLTKINPLLHFIRYGWKKGRNPSAFFDTNYYLSHNLDVKETGINPLYHYIRYGRYENRRVNTSVNHKSENVEIMDKSVTKQFVPPGHFYSPIPSSTDIEQYVNSNRNRLPNNIPGIDLNVAEQLRLAEEFTDFYSEIPFTENKIESLRYYFNNDAFGYGDAVILYSMLRRFKPGRLIEIGSGFSSCVTLDTNEYFLNNQINCFFIEPFPGLLRNLIKTEDKTRVNIKPNKLQEINTNFFKNLQAGDILFVDSTHVSKVNSDVNQIIFEILPALSVGVFIHFHDIFYPFEYPTPWLLEGRAWNEDYLLRAFLMYNEQFKIVFFNNFMGQMYSNIFNMKMPLFLKNIGGSLWLRKIK